MATVYRSISGGPIPVMVSLRSQAPRNASVVFQPLVVGRHMSLAGARYPTAMAASKAANRLKKLVHLDAELRKEAWAQLTPERNPTTTPSRAPSCGCGH